MALRCSPVFIVCEKWAAVSKVETQTYKSDYLKNLVFFIYWEGK
jgi:hypothetical protein